LWLKCSASLEDSLEVENRYRESLIHYPFWWNKKISKKIPFLCHSQLKDLFHPL